MAISSIIEKVNVKQKDGNFITRSFGANAENIVINENSNLLDKIKEWDNKVSSEENKFLSSNNYTDEEKEKLKKIKENAQKNILKAIEVDDEILPIENKIVKLEPPSEFNLAIKNHISESIQYGLASEENYGHAKFGNTADSIVEATDLRLSDKREPISHASENEDFGIADSKFYGHTRILKNAYTDSYGDYTLISIPLKAKTVKDILSSYANKIEFDNENKIISIFADSNKLDECEISDGNCPMCIIGVTTTMEEFFNSTHEFAYYAGPSNYDDPNLEKSSSPTYTQYSYGNITFSNNGEGFLKMPVRAYKLNSEIVWGIYSFSSSIGNMYPYYPYLSDIKNKEDFLNHSEVTTCLNIPSNFVDFNIITKDRSITNCTLKANYRKFDDEYYNSKNDKEIANIDLLNGYGHFRFYSHSSMGASNTLYFWVEYEENKTTQLEVYYNIDGGINYSYDFILYENNIPLVSWSTGTDAQITAMINGYYNGDLSLSDIQSVWSLGDCRSVNLSAIGDIGFGWKETHRAQTVELQILDFLHDELESPINGKSKALITVQLKDMLKDANCTDYSSNTEKGTMSYYGYAFQGWSDCPRRKWCNTKFYYAIPLAIRRLIKTVNKETIEKVYRGENKKQITKDLCFLISSNETHNLPKNDENYGDGFPYAYYRQTESNLAKLPKNGDAKTGEWLLRSCFNAGFYRMINGAYGVSSVWGTSKYGIAPAFCL